VLSGSCTPRKTWCTRHTCTLPRSLTQFTPASMDVVPKNVYERVYNIMIVLIVLTLVSRSRSLVADALPAMRCLP